jgi:hypothetical protein
MKYVGILGVGAVLVAGFAYYTLFAGPTAPEAPERSSADDVAAEAVPVDPLDQEREDFAGAGTLASLVARNESLECQVTYIPNPLEDEITGSFFTANGNVRGDFLVSTPDLNGQMLSSVIFDGDTLYSWSEIDGELYGFKMATDTFISDEESDTAPIPDDTEVQYNCLTWPAVDYTIFEPPTSVLFTDMTDVSGVMETGILYEAEGEF